MKTMKTRSTKASIVFLILNLMGGSGLAHAQRTLAIEDGHVGGGDLCRDEIEQHRIRVDQWIRSDLARGLDFSIALIPGLNYEKYKENMLFFLQPGKVIVTCYSDLNKLNEIAAIHSISPETVNLGSGCINYEDEHNVSHIGCDFQSIMLEKARVQSQPYTPDENYKLIHHEFASIAGMEQRMGTSQSDWSLSNQIAEFQTFRVVPELGLRVKPTRVQPAGPGASALLSNPSLGDRILFSSASDQNGVCRAMGYERAAVGTMVRGVDFNAKVVVDDNGVIFRGENGDYQNGGHDSISEIVCVNKLNGPNNQTVTVIDPKHPTSGVVFSSVSNQDGVCKSQGYPRSANGSATRSVDFNSKVIVDASGSIVGGEDGDYQRGGHDRIGSIICLNN
jgi:hypothetical protein